MYINPKENTIPFKIEKVNNYYKLKKDFTEKEYLELEKYLHVNNIEKPFTALSSYKLGELKNMILMLKLSLDNKEKKQDLYNKLIEYSK